MKKLLWVLLVLISMCLISTVVFAQENSLTITEQPTSVSVPAGETATISFQAEGEGLKYQWYFKNKGSNIFYPTYSFDSNTYQLEMNSARDGRSVYCVVTDKYGNNVRTNTVTLTRKSTLQITKQPTSVSATIGKTATVSFQVEGEGLKYQWYFKNKGDSIFYPSYSFDGNTYEVKMNKARDGREIYCVVTDKYGERIQTETVTMSMKVHSEGLEFTLSADKTYYTLTGIGDCQDTDIVIPDEYEDLPVRSIGKYAFYDCNSLTSITIPDGVTSIGDWAFSGCNSLKAVYYCGTKSSWQRINISTSTLVDISDLVYFYSEQQPSDTELNIGSYWRYVNGVPTCWVPVD